MEYSNADYDKLKRQKTYKEIRNNLRNQLTQAGNDTKYYLDLIEDYMSLYCTKILLTEDIRDRGVRVKYDNGGGQCGHKKNESVDQIIKVNAQMLKILSELGISPSNEGSGDYEEL